MRKRKVLIVCLASVMILSSLTLTGCGDKGEEVVTEAVAETDIDGNVITGVPMEDAGAMEMEGEETEAPTQKVGIAFSKAAESEVQEEIVLPIDEFAKYGKVSRAKEGFRILQKDGTYVTDSMLRLGEKCYYFNENGYMSDNVFVPKKASDGSVNTFYVHNYEYQYGFIEIEGHTYYIDEEDGRLEGESRVIEGETYYFDKNGRKISKAGYEKMRAKDGSLSLEGSLAPENTVSEESSVAEGSGGTEESSGGAVEAETASGAVEAETTEAGKA